MDVVWPRRLFAAKDGFEPLHMSRTGNRAWRIVHSECSLGWGGQEQRILAELAGFRKRGCAVTLLAPRESRIFQVASQEGIPVRALAAGKLRFPVSVAQTALWLRRERIDIVNPHSSQDGWLVGLAGRCAGVPLIIRTRHFDVPIRQRWLSYQVYARLCDHILTTSPRVTAHLQELFQLPSDRVSTVPTGVDVRQFSPEGAKARFPAAPQMQSVPLIGLIGVIRQAKGHLVLLEAARLLQDSGLRAHYLFVGDGPSIAPVERKVKELNLSDSVTFTGFRKDIPEILRALDILVIPSLHEGIPQVGLQALAAKTPVIGSDVGGIPAIIRPGETGRLFPAGNAAALAQAIRETLANPESTRALAERGRRLVKSEHSVEAMLDAIEAIYTRYLP
ncbi:MAG: glycosyltransferase family 4 protein [Chloroflexi bacterium]|nr:glycosyltransferase family 4 protein [Chloroflexota bacterium]